MSPSFFDANDSVSPADWNSDPTVARKIELRHFAGPERFATQLDRPIRLAHLTDLHVGRITPMKVQHAAVQLVNAHAPDVVVITGDFVCHSQVYLDTLTELMRGIRAPVFAVLGNHDHWSGGPEVRNALIRGGVEVLNNANTVLEVGHQRLQFVGLDDAYTGHADREHALRGIRTDLPTIGLSHIAEEADALWTRGVPLVLSGHTHAGQVTLARINEWLLGKVAGHKYVHGLYGTRKHNTNNAQGAVYVGAGIGAAVMPLRMGARGKREVAIFELGVLPGMLDEHHDEQEAHTGRPPSPETKAKRAAAVVEKREARERKKERNNSR